MTCLISATGFSIVSMDLRGGQVFWAVCCYIVRRRVKGEMTYACAASSHIDRVGCGAGSQ